MDYPLLGLQARVTGSVRLRAKVDSGGSIIDVAVLSGNPVLAKAAAQNLNTWKFARRTSLPGNFKLAGETASRPRTEFVSEYANHVTGTSAAPHWMPEAASRSGRAKQLHPSAPLCSSIGKALSPAGVNLKTGATT